MDLGNPLLLLVAIPLLSGAFCVILPGAAKWLARTIAFLVSGLAFASAVFLFINRAGAWQLNSYPIFIQDNLSSFVAMGIAFFAFVVTVYSFGCVNKSVGKYFGYVLITLGSALGAAFSSNFITLVLFWGVVAAMLYLMVNMAGTDRSAQAAKKTLIMVGGTDAFMIFGVAIIWAITGSFTIGPVRVEFSGILPYAAYLAIIAAAFAKAGAMPFHSWLPDVAQDGPTTVTAFLPASIDKLLGVYLLARISMTIFNMNNISNIILMACGSMTIILAGILAIQQNDMKRTLGYCAVSQVGYIVLGVGTGNPIGMAGALFHMINHAVYKSCLFLSGGDVEHRTGTTDLSKLGGLSKYMPLTFLAFLVASLSVSGIPPFNGFFSKWLIYQGIIDIPAGSGGFASGKLKIVWLAAAMFGSAFTVAIVMKLLHAVFMGRASSLSEKAKEVGLFMIIPVLILAAICLIFGIFAFSIPLPLFITPIIGAGLSYLGSWSPVAATVLVLIGIAIGALVYLALRSARFRRTDSFVGGEAQETFGRIPGTEFYNTVKDMKAFGVLYVEEARGELDIYAASGNIIRRLVTPLQKLHNGILPTYLAWCMIGVVAALAFIFLR